MSNTKIFGANHGIATSNVIPDNNSTALDIESTDAKDYITIDTTDNEEKIVLTHKTVVTDKGGASGNIGQIDTSDGRKADALVIDTADDGGMTILGAGNDPMTFNFVSNAIGDRSFINAKAGSSDGNQYLALGTGAVEGLRLQTSGSDSVVGIGNVASPDALLHVQGTAISTTRPAFNADTVAIFENDVNCSIQILTKDSSSAIAEINMGGNGEDREGNLRYIVSEQKMEVGPRNAGSKMGLYTAGNQRLHIDASGNTAIGASTPEHKFHVQDGDLGIVTNSNDDVAKSLLFTKSRNTTIGDATIVQNNDILGRIDWYGADASSGDTDDNKTIAASIYSQIDGAPGHEDMPGSIRMATTADDTAALSDRFVIRRNGNIGLGDTEPNYRAVIGGGLSTPILYAYNSNTSVMSNAITSIPNGAAGAVFDHRVSDSIYCMNTTSTNAADGRGTGIAFFGRVDIGSDASGSNDSYPMQGAIRVKHEGSAEDQKGYMAFYTNDGTDDRAPTERMRIRSNGKIGINDSDPSYRLTVKAGSTHEDLVLCRTSTSHEALRLEVYDNNSGALRIYSTNSSGTQEQNQHVIVGRNSSNGSVQFNIQQHDCDFTHSSSNSTKALHVDASLDQVVIINDNVAYGREHLDETDYSSHAEWDVAGDFSDSGGDATYTHSSGAGTLTQVEADQAFALLGDRYYVLTYTVSAVSGTDMAATITTGVAHEAVSLTVNANGTYKTSFLAKNNPGDFVISATSTTGGTTFTLDNVSLKSAGGELVVGNRVRLANGSNNVLIGDTNTGSALGASTGYNNILIGADAGINLATGHQCTAIGDIAMGACQAAANLTTAIGRKAGYAAGNTGTYIGAYAGEGVTGYSNTALGYSCMNLDGPDNGVAVGRSAHGSCTGDQNVAVGAYSLDASGTAGKAVAVGYDALGLCTGIKNTGLGYEAGNAITDGTENICIGHQSDAGASNVKVIAIGNQVAGTTNQRAYIGDGSNQSTLDFSGASNSWTATSDSRIKENVQDGDLGLDFINSLRTVKYTEVNPADWPEEIRSHVYTDRERTRRNEKGEKETYIEPANERPETSTKVFDGLIAQEVIAAAAAAGSTFSGIDDGESNGLLRLQYERMVIPLIKAVQELSLKVKALEEQGN